MLKMYTISLILCLFVATGLTVPVEISMNEVEDVLPEIGRDHHKPLHEVVHVHHVPVQIPVYASMVVHESQHKPQQSQSSHASSNIHPFYSMERDAPSCAAPNNAGFSKLFREASDLLPKRQISEIVKHAVRYDPEVRQFRKMFFSQETLKMLLNLRSTTQFDELTNYSCKRLFLNMRKFFKFLSCMISAEEPEIQMESTTHELAAQDFKGRPGLRGMIMDIYDILPHQELRALYKRLKESDRYLKYSLRQLQSPEFQELLMNMRDVPEYRELKKQFEDAGLPIEEYNELYAAAMGWENDFPAKVFQI